MHRLIQRGNRIYWELSLDRMELRVHVQVILKYILLFNQIDDKYFSFYQYVLNVAILPEQDTQYVEVHYLDRIQMIHPEKERKRDLY